MCVRGVGICDNSISFTTKDTAHKDISPVALIKDG